MIYKDLTLKFSPSLGSCSGDYYRHLDLDRPKFTGSTKSDDSDLRYYCLGSAEPHKGSIEVLTDATIGESPAKGVDQASCEMSANTGSATELMVPDMRVGRAWCMLTSQGQVAWIRLIRKGPPYVSAGFERNQVPTLTLKVTVWAAP